MKKSAFILLAIATSFCSGFAFKGMTTKGHSEQEEKGRVTGIGGVFFKCKDPKKVRAWYQTHLGLNVNSYGAVFEWRQGQDTTKKGFTQWSPFIETTKYFGDPKQDFMVNYRVEHMEALIAQLRMANVQIADSMETYDYGKFVHIIDVEGNKIELWEPDDAAYEAMGKQMGATTTK